MKIFGYCWAGNHPETDSSEPAEGVELVRQYFKRRRWTGPIHLESPEEAFIDFHLRTTGENLLALLRPLDVLVVPDQNYLFRSASQGLNFLSRMHERSVAVHCVDRGTNIAQGKLLETFISILEPLALAEPQFLREQVRLRKRQGRLLGRYLGGNLPIGFSVNAKGELEPNGNREALLKMVLPMKVKGMSLRDIAEELQKKGYSISHTGVDRLLKSVAYSSKKFAKFV
jgi:DNA invertase Pin-like site-specific DNA recombinase